MLRAFKRMLRAYMPSKNKQKQHVGMYAPSTHSFQHRIGAVWRQTCPKGHAKRSKGAHPQGPAWGVPSQLPQEVRMKLCAALRCRFFLWLLPKGLGARAAVERSRCGAMCAGRRRAKCKRSVCGLSGGVADSKLGGLTEGQFQVTITADYSDAVEADGRINSWQRPSWIRPLSYEIRQPINVREYSVRLSG